MYVNGKPYRYRDGLTLHALLDELALDQRKVAVMQGDEVFKAGNVPNTPVVENDVIEIVQMMQGG
jgi:thiamine biosynthesis protein ThiS